MAGLVVQRIGDKYGGITEDDHSSINTTSTPSDTEHHTVSHQQIAATLTFLIGIIQVIMGVLRLDFVATYFSDQVVAGFSTGASCHVFVSQLKHILAIKGLPQRTGYGQLLLKLYDMFSHITHANIATIVISIIAMAFLIVGKDFVQPFLKKRFNLPIPIPFELILVILSTIISYFANFYVVFHVPIVKDIPTGMPTPELPRFSVMSEMISDAIGIAVVTIAIHISLAKMFAKKKNYKVDVGQEFYAVGLTGILCGFFPVYPTSCSLGRTLVNVETGTKTQFSSVFSSALLLIMILWFGQYLRTLPMCILSSIITVALIGMFKKIKELRHLWPLSKIDFSIWLVSFIATSCIDVTTGLVISICYALLTTVFRTQWPRWHMLSNLQNTDDFRDSERYHLVTEYSDIAIFRFDCPLLFTNVETFKRTIHKVLEEWKVSKHPQRCLTPSTITQSTKNSDGILNIDVGFNSAQVSPKTSDHYRSKHFIIDCSGFTFVDCMGVNALKEIFSEMRSHDVVVYFAAAKAPVRELFDSCGFHSFVPKDNFYPTVRDALIIARRRQKRPYPELLLQPAQRRHDVIQQLLLTHPTD
ncbi:hypothetical protein AB6A40_003074 [Gnathostoma spinigerum]|uniref:STAS domain-containing protein n=1 Tax=Gnathostoma spinigerum TaxID=75299 RepID=A0ABD6EJ99_9BILA